MIRTLALSLLLLPGLAHADALVAAGGKPGVAKSWSAKGEAVVLTLAEGFDAEEIAEAIEGGVPGAKATVEGDGVSVSGVPEAELIAALERVEVDPALDDIDAAFAAMQGQASDDDDSGSSIRATSAKTMPGHSDAKVMVSAKVLKVRHKRFPLVAITVKATDGAHKGQTLIVVPAIDQKNGAVGSDAQSQKNVAAWYARPGDKVKVTLGEKKKKYFVATTFERVR